MRASWKGAVGLGLLSAPVELFTSVSDENVGFKQLCPTHKCTIQQRTVCREGGEDVARADLAKGYEIEPGKYVVLTDDDLEKAALPMSKVLEIEVCVPEAELDLRYFDKPYIASPPKKDPGRVYALLHAALARTGLVAIGRVTFRTKQHIAAVRVLGPYLCVHLMHWPDELHRLEGFRLATAEVRPGELDLAEQLVTGLVGDFSEATFTDQHRENVMKLIEARASGEPDVEFTPQAEPEATGIDLMAVLQASVAQAAARVAA